MLRPAVLAAVLMLAALAPATASAGLPRPASTAIVPGTSIGGVSIGMTVKRALARWGPGSSCSASTVRGTCTWTGSGFDGTASFTIGSSRKVRSVAITAGHNERSLVYTGPLMRWRTGRKIHLGSRAASVAKLYPKARSSPSGPQLGTGSRSTIFTKSSRRISQIYIGPPF